VFKKSLEELGIGTFKNLVTATPDDKVCNILKLFKEAKVTAVPIIAQDGAILDVFSRYDITYLIQTDADDYFLNKTIDEALKLKSRVPVFTCMKNESFEKVLRHLATSKIHRLFVVDGQSRVIGVVSVSDIFNFLLALCKKPL